MSYIQGVERNDVPNMQAAKNLLALAASAAIALRTAEVAFRLVSLARTLIEAAL